MQRLFVVFSAVLCVSISVVSCYCSNDESSIANYEEVKDLPSRPEVLLIDVREVKEIEESGSIPTSINIPLGSLRETLSSKTEQQKFLEKYGRRFPDADDEIIFYCRSGRRAQEAMEIACSLGFNRSRNYKGSWLDWAEREGIVPRA